MIPDAPWIRAAEEEGMESDDPPICPICYEEAERFYFITGTREIVGCENCIDYAESWTIEI